MPENISVTYEKTTVSTGGGEGDRISAAVMGAALENMWDRVIRGLVYALAFLTPLLFTPWTVEALEFSKQTLGFMLITAALAVWLLKILVLRHWHFVKTVLDLPIAVFLGIYLLASLFSVDRIASFLGFYGSFSGNFFQIFSLVLFYYLIVNHFHAAHHVKSLIRFFFAGILVAVIYAVLQFIGWFVLPFEVSKATSFNTVGGLLPLSVAAALGVILPFAFSSKSLLRFPEGRIWRGLAVVLSLVILATINFIYAWAALLIGLILYMIFRFSFTQNVEARELLIPLVLIIITVSFLLIQMFFPSMALNRLLKFDLPSAVRLDYETAGPVLTGVVRNDPILGTGPSTFQYAFSQYRDPGFNLSAFWNVRFDKGPSEASEFLVGSGILGFLAFEILTVIFLIYGFLFLIRNRGTFEWKTGLAAFAAFATLWVAHWFLFFNTVISFSFWLTLAAFMALSRIATGEGYKSYQLSFLSNPRRTVSVISVVSLMLIFVVVFFVFTTSVYAAEVFFRMGLAQSQDPATFNPAQENLETAIRLNRFRPDYNLAYSEFLLTRINQELSREQPNLGLIQGWILASINTSRAAVELSPNNWTSWERLANLYNFARPLVPGVDEFIIDSLTRATEVDNKNPILFTELGQVYRLAASSINPAILGEGSDGDNDGISDRQEQIIGSNPDDPDTNGNNIIDSQELLSGLNPATAGTLPDSFLNQYIRVNQENLIKAEEAFRKAIELKEDYATAYYQLGLTLEQSGKNEDAVAELRKALARFPGNVAIKFDLGRLLFNVGDLDAATRQFQELLVLAPTHSNARFSLGLSYERQGQTERALREYRRLLEQNPGNESISQKIQQLEEILVNTGEDSE